MTENTFGDDELSGLDSMDLEGLDGISQDLNEDTNNAAVSKSPKVLSHIKGIKLDERTFALIGPRPRPNKPLRFLTPEEKRELRVKERKWSKDLQSLKQRVQQNADSFGNPSHSPPTTASPHDKDSKVVAEMKNLQKRFLQLISPEAKNQMGTAANLSAESANSQTGARPKVKPKEVGNRETPKRNRENISAEKLSAEKPKKKSKPNTHKIHQTRDQSQEELKIFIEKKDLSNPLTTTEMTRMASKLHAAVINECLKKNPVTPPIILGNFRTRNGYCIVCGDLRTREWLKDSYKDIFAMDLTLIDGKSLYKGHHCTIFVPEPKKELDLLLHVFTVLNPGLNTNKWIVRNLIFHPDDSSLLRVLVDDDTKDFLEKRDMKLLCGIGYASARLYENSAAAVAEDSVPMDTGTTDINSDKQ